MRIGMTTPLDVAVWMAALRRFSRLALWVATLAPDFIASKERRTMARALLRAAGSYRRSGG